ncbi:conserved hypothetical protein [Mesorhizobium ventifaucium]|uniref:Uncharacterized protein n=1 Tax=Mesorhizobium ventifaucium TaxID=666020 RepID=A0ABM9E426_9HYPH|nr:conserved hypothetical protein [Mesorhizobium ventifaucium]
MDPVPEAGPGLAIETVALDRHLAGDDRVQHALAGILEAAFVDDPARGRIDDPRRGMQYLDSRPLEGEVDERMRGLRRIAALPVGLADPVAELQPAIGGVEAGTTDESFGTGKRQGIGDPGPARHRHRQEDACLGLAIGVRHAGQHFGDVAVVGEHHQLLDIAFARRPQDQPLGHQDRTIYRVTFTVCVFRFGNHVSPPGTRKRGKWKPISPDPFPGLARHRFPRWVPVFSYGTGYSAAFVIGFTDT